MYSLRLFRALSPFYTLGGFYTLTLRLFLDIPLLFSCINYCFLFNPKSQVPFFVKTTPAFLTGFTFGVEGLFLWMKLEAGTGTTLGSLHTGWWDYKGVALICMISAKFPSSSRETLWWLKGGLFLLTCPTAFFLWKLGVFTFCSISYGFGASEYGMLFCWFSCSYNKLGGGLSFSGASLLFNAWILWKTVWENSLMFCDSVRSDLILLLMMGELRIWLIVGRKLGLVLSIHLINWLSSLEYWGGMCEKEPFTIFKARNWMLLAVKGGVRAHISYRMAPSDQMSVLNE